MADQLYLSVWFPDFQLSALPSKLIAVMRQFAVISGSDRVVASAAYPISFSEPPVYQRAFVDDARSEDSEDAHLENAVAEATEQLHEDTAYEFELRWKLWTPEAGFGNPVSASELPSEFQDAQLDPLWRPQLTTVKIIGFGPEFDDAAFEQNGHIRIDFGLDYPWVLDDEDEVDDHPETPSASPGAPGNADRSPREGGNVLPFRRPGTAAPPAAELSDAAQYIQRNIEMLLAFTLSVEKHCGISSRLLWTESGEPLAEKLIARLQRLH